MALLNIAQGQGITFAVEYQPNGRVNALYCDNQNPEGRSCRGWVVMPDGTRYTSDSLNPPYFEPNAPGSPTRVTVPAGAGLTVGQYNADGEIVTALLGFASLGYALI